MTVVTDPFSHESIGISYPPTDADIVTVSHNHNGHNAIKQIGGQPFVISAPGEYEVKDVMIFGIPYFHDASQGSEKGKNTAYLIEVEGLRLCHLGDLGHTLSPEQLNGLSEGVDILFLPVGGGSALGPREAAELVGKIEPSTVIPMHYQTPGLKKELFDQLLPVEDFLKEVDGQTAPIPKLVVTREKVIEEGQVVVLEKKG